MQVCLGFSCCQAPSGASGLGQVAVHRDGVLKGELLHTEESSRGCVPFKCRVTGLSNVFMTTIGIFQRTDRAGW